MSKNIINEHYCDEDIEITIRKPSKRVDKYIELEKRIITNFKLGDKDKWIDEFGNEWIKKEGLKWKKRD